MSFLFRILCTIACTLAVCANPGRDFAIQSRITGQHSAVSSPSEFPHMVSILAGLPSPLPFLTTQKSHTCGGSVIGPKWVLTAAHCLCNGYINQILALLSGTPLSPATRILSSITCQLTDPRRLAVAVNSIFLNPRGTVLDVEKVVQHPDYDSAQILNDVGLLLLKSETTATPIALSGVVPVGQIFTLSGWGLENGTDQDLPNQLQTAILNQLAIPDCASRINTVVSGASVTNKNLCSLGPASPCPGDSGSPILATLNLSTGAKRVQVCIVSWGISVGNSVCGNGYPDVCTNVCEFCDFISGETQIGCVL